MAEAGLAPGPMPSSLSPDSWVRGLAALPLLHQPGQAWMYHTSSDLLGVLIARASGQRFEDFLEDRIFGPLGMKDTAFFAPDDKNERLATAYMADSQTGRLAVFDDARGGAWSRLPAFPSGGGGLVSTADDFQAFGRMLLDFGRFGSARISSRPSVELMTIDHITPEQKAASPFSPGFWQNNGWGFGVSIVTRRSGIADTPGRYGWDGGFGTSWRNDPKEDMTCIFLIQRMMRGPDDIQLNEDFLTLAYQAIDD